MTSRELGSVDENPGLCIRFHEGKKELVGENDSGRQMKIADALKLVLHAQGGEYVRRPSEGDSHARTDGLAVSEDRIE